LGRLFGRGQTEWPAAQSPEYSGTKLERILGYSFARGELLETALTHPSAAVGSDVHYERLEFLGDAVLDLAIADLLMRKFPTAKEGPLSKQRASIVNARTLALKAQAIELNEMMRLGKGEEKSGGREKTSILAAVFEAVIGAIYTDGGLAPAQRVVERLFENDIGGPSTERDYKTELQEIAYRHFHTQPFTNWSAPKDPITPSASPLESESRAATSAWPRVAARSRVNRPRRASRSIG